MPGPRDWPDHVDSGHDDDSNPPPHVDSGHDDDSNPPPHVDSGHDDDGDQPPHVDSSHDDAGDTPFERLEEIVDEILRQQERLVPAVRAQLGRMARELTRAVSAMQRRLSGLERRVGGGGGGAGAARRRRLERKLRALAARRPKLIAAVRGQFGAMSREAARVFRGLDERLDALERSVARLEGKKR